MPALRSAVAGLTARCRVCVGETAKVVVVPYVWATTAVDGRYPQEAGHGVRHSMWIATPRELEGESSRSIAARDREKRSKRGLTATRNGYCT